MDRRSLLITLATVGSGAGCVGRLSPLTNAGFPLGSVHLWNTTDNSRSIDLRIYRDADSVYSDKTEINPHEEILIQPTWPSQPASYQLYCVVDGTDELQVFNLSDRHSTDGDCNVFSIQIRDHNRFITTEILSVDDLEEATCNL